MTILQDASSYADQNLFRAVMGSVATPVTVVTTAEDGVPHGTTVSAFSSLSMEPPMVLVCLDLRSTLLERIRRTGKIGISVLAIGQAGLAMQFASKKGADKFLGVPWRLDRGLPRIEGAAGWLACDIAEMIIAGDHVIVTADVRDAEQVAVDPMVYHLRRFGTHRVPE